MKSLGFGSSLVFGVLASMALVVAQGIAGPWLGYSAVIALFLAASATTYAALLGDTRRARIRSGAAALAGALLVLLLARGLSEISIGLAVVVALVRGLGVRRAQPLRALGVEIALGLGGLCLARWLAAPSALGVAAAFWGYWLVQSAYFLVSGAGSAQRPGERGDRFEHARDRLNAMLEQS